jgi:fatty acid desaturase
MNDRVGRAPATIEWPTVGLAILIYTAFGLLTFYHTHIPLWLLVPLGAYVVTWQSSLQHEVIHGHPTPWPWANLTLAGLPLTLWLPLLIYRRLHLTHHTDHRLTDPLDDPESYYVTQEVWERMRPWQRRARSALNTLAGRLLLGPLLTVPGFLAQQAVACWQGENGARRVWLWHLAGLLPLLGWLLVVCSMPFWTYVLVFALPGTSLMMLRSFAEHQARHEIGQRTAIVEAEAPLALLFLNNNLHAVHHAHPGQPWYRLPALYRREREAVLAANGGYLIKGYAEILRSYLLVPKEPPIHPWRHDGPATGPADPVLGGSGAAGY